MNIGGSTALIMKYTLMKKKRGLAFSSLFLSPSIYIYVNPYAVDSNARIVKDLFYDMGKWILKTPRVASVMSCPSYGFIHSFFHKTL